MGRTLLRIDAGAWPYASHFKSRCLSLLPRSCPGIAARTIGGPKNAFGRGRSPHAGRLFRFYFQRKFNVIRANSRGFVTKSWAVASNRHAYEARAQFCRTDKNRYPFRFRQPRNRVRALRAVAYARVFIFTSFIRNKLAWADFKSCLRIGVDELAGVGRRQE